jgi:hypothetical protein
MSLRPAVHEPEVQRGPLRGPTRLWRLGAFLARRSRLVLALAGLVLVIAGALAAGTARRPNWSSGSAPAALT